jgi:hypothetical protein
MKIDDLSLTCDPTYTVGRCPRCIHDRMLRLLKDLDAIYATDKVEEDKPDAERPGHVYRIDLATGATIYVEDEIMESVLGRKLKVGEEVWHIDGNFFNNRKQNLELIVTENFDA